MLIRVLCASDVPLFAWISAEKIYDPAVGESMLLHDVMHDDVVLVGGHSSYTYNYTISDGVITTTTPYGSTSYKIVRLDRYIMEWQKVGTEFSEGTLISDYKRFKRKSRRVKGDLSIILSDAIWSRMMSINIPDLFRL